MSSAPTPADIELLSAPSERRPPVTWMRRVMGDTASRASARVGLVWIGIIAFCGVFAPFLANSHPYLMKTVHGEVTSPLLRHLTPADVIILIGALTAILFLLLRWIPSYIRWATFCVLLAATIALSAWFVSPPRAVVYSKHRVMEAQGQIEWAIHAPVPYSPSDRQRDLTGVRHPTPPDSTHWLGTEPTGDDILSRMIHASRIAMAVGFIATGIAMVLGVIIGGLMGYFSGIVDLLGMRLVEVFAAIPVFFLLLTFVAFFPRNLYLMMAIIGITGWVGYARFIRAEFLKLRQQDFVQAARACGLPLRSILFKHMLPNGVAPVLVEASFGVAAAILYEATLSFLGVGLVDEPSWGQLLNQAVSSGGGFHWWLATFPGLAIFLSVFGFNLVGEATRDAIDPHTKRAAA